MAVTAPNTNIIRQPHTLDHPYAQMGLKLSNCAVISATNWLAVREISTVMRRRGLYRDIRNCIVSAARQEFRTTINDLTPPVFGEFRLLTPVTLEVNNISYISQVHITPTRTTTIQLGYHKVDSAITKHYIISDVFVDEEFLADSSLCYHIPRSIIDDSNVRASLKLCQVVITLKHHEDEYSSGNFRIETSRAIFTCKWGIGDICQFGITVALVDYKCKACGQPVRQMRGFKYNGYCSDHEPPRRSGFAPIHVDF